MTKKFVYPAAVASVMAPALAMAATLDTVINTVANLLAKVVPILITLALIYFFWGLAKYILQAGDEKARAVGVRMMIGGVVALFVMVSVWGLVNLLSSTFIGGGNTNAPDVNNLIPRQ